MNHSKALCLLRDKASYDGEARPAVGSSLLQALAVERDIATSLIETMGFNTSQLMDSRQAILVVYLVLLPRDGDGNMPVWLLCRDECSSPILLFRCLDQLM